MTDFIATMCLAGGYMTTRAQVLSGTFDGRFIQVDLA